MFGDLQATDDALTLKPDQDLVLKDSHGTERLRLDASDGAVRIRSAGAKVVVLLDAANSNLLLGAFGKDGDLLLYPQSADGHEVSKASLHADAGQASLRIGTDQLPGKFLAQGSGHRIELDADTGRVRATRLVELRTTGGDTRLRLESVGAVAAGGDGKGGQVRIRNSKNETTILLNGGAETLGGNGVQGELLICDANGNVTIHLNGGTGNMALGRAGNAGGLFVKDASGGDVAVINGDSGNMALGRAGNGGDLFLKDDSGENTIVARGTTANLGLGRVGREGNLFVHNDAGESTIHLSGQTGDILLRNADCAEEFEVSDDAGLEPGTVMVIDEGERLRLSRTAYDQRVAGVLSGAGDYRPGIVLDRRPELCGRWPLALVGKIYCKVDAGYGAVEVGDLLTTSDTAGYAMKAGDPLRAFGAIIGKALRPLPAGRGLIPILIALQ
jgi:hypothetical protein